MFRLARKQGALSGYVHPFSNDPRKTSYGVARGFPVDLALGSFDYLEVMTSATGAKFTSEVWHRAMNCGFKVTASGGEDSISNLHRTPVVGAARVYAHLGGKLEWGRWVDAIREGRTFITNGPLLDFKVNGEMPGGEIRLPAAGGSVEFSALTETAFPVERVEVIFNGKVVETVPLSEGGRLAELAKRIDVRESGWLTLRAVTDRPVFPIDDTHLFAETGPVFVYCGDKPIRSKADAEYFIKWIDDITVMARDDPGWRSDREREHVLRQFAAARTVFEQRAAEAAR
jgi:TolB protein